jgi:RimJ/RimL family protein N-acetyltransferase
VGRFTSLCRPLEAHREQFADDDCIYFVVETPDGTRCAYCLLRGLTNALRIIYLQRICVDLDDHRGRGVGVALMVHIIHFAFDTLGAHKFYLNCADVNARGRHVYEKVGMVLESHDRDSSTDARLHPQTGEPLHGSTVVRAGSCQYGLLRREYAELAGIQAVDEVDPTAGPSQWEPVEPGEPWPERTLTGPVADHNSKARL